MIHNSPFMIPRIIVSAIEHESVLETARDLEKDGVEVVVLPVDRHGVVDLKKLKSSLNNRTVLVSIMYANNEIGTIQPIVEISEIISEFRTGKTYPLFHTDAVQAFQFLDCNVNDLGIDLMTLSAHKIYGPKGIGALYARDMRHETRDKKQEARNGLRENNSLSLVACRLSPLTTGGGQEFGLRSGTENVPSIVGFAKAVELALAAREKEGKRIAALRDYFLRGITKIYPKAKLNGAPQNELPITNYQLPNILNMFSPGIAAQDLLTRLDLAGVAASAGSACAARSFTPSATLQALGYSADRAKQSVRFSFGRPTTKAEIDKALSAIKIILHNH